MLFEKCQLQREKEQPFLFYSESFWISPPFFPDFYFSVTLICKFKEQIPPRPAFNYWSDQEHSKATIQWYRIYYINVHLSSPYPFPQFLVKHKCLQIIPHNLVPQVLLPHQVRRILTKYSKKKHTHTFYNRLMYKLSNKWNMQRKRSNFLFSIIVY